MNKSAEERVKKALRLVDKGVPYTQACKQSKVSINTYYKYKRHERQAAKGPDDVKVRVYDGAKRISTPRKKTSDIAHRKLALLEAMAETLRTL